MSGGFRFLLALLVAFCHLVGFAGGIGAVSHVGFFAVFAFYTLSGYFISTVLRDVYKFRFGDFITNRVLRLYPQYFIVASLTVLVVFLAQKPISFHLIKQDWWLSTDIVSILANILIFPFPFVLPSDSYILVPQAWSIGVEILCYGLLWLFIARHPRNAFLVILLSAVYDAVTYQLGFGWGVRYYLLPAALLPFSIGSFMSWYTDHRTQIARDRLILFTTIAAIAWIINLVMTGVFAPVGTSRFDVFFFINLGLVSALVFFLVDARHVYLSRSMDSLLGKMSYPIFLTHWVLGFVVRRTFLAEQPFGNLGFSLFFASLPVILVAAYGLVLIQERTFDPIREQIRSLGLSFGSARRVFSR